MAKTKGQLEAEISDAIVRFELEYMGRGPEEARTYLVDVTGQAVRSLNTDISTLLGERIIVFSLAGPVQLPAD